MSERDEHTPRRYKVARRSPDLKRGADPMHPGSGAPAPEGEKETAPEAVSEAATEQTAPAPEKEAPASQGAPAEDAAEEKPDAPEENANAPEEEYKDRTRILPQDSFDYVVPHETFKQHARRKHRDDEKRARTTKGATREELDEAESGYVFYTPNKRRRHHHHHHHHHRRGWYRLRRWQRLLIILAALLLTLLIAAGGTYLILNEIGRSSMHNYNSIDVVPPTEDEEGNDIIMVDKSGLVITYDGVSYELNTNLISVAFIGTDEGTGDFEGLNMADAIYILTVDTETGKVKILGISRDTMADVDLYSEEGSYIDTQRMQMALSYAYGNGKVTGGKNTTASLTRLFYGLPFENYFAINLDALITLNDTIGGVTLTSSMTFTSPIDGRTIYEGDTVTLHGKEAEYYVRHRDTELLDSNNLRMNHQQEYIRAFLGSIVPAAKKDMSLVTELYNQIKVNSETTLDLPKMTYIISTALTKLDRAADIEYVSLTGEVTSGEFAEMNVSNEDAIRTMLDVFYTPLASVPDTTD